MVAVADGDDSAPGATSGYTTVDSSWNDRCWYSVAPVPDASLSVASGEPDPGVAHEHDSATSAEKSSAYS